MSTTAGMPRSDAGSSLAVLPSLPAAPPPAAGSPKTPVAATTQQCCPAPCRTVIERSSGIEFACKSVSKTLDIPNLSGACMPACTGARRRLLLGRLPVAPSLLPLACRCSPGSDRADGKARACCCNACKCTVQDWVRGRLGLACGPVVWQLRRWHAVVCRGLLPAAWGAVYDVTPLAWCSWGAAVAP